MSVMSGDKKILNVAIVGAGEVAMIVHLPNMQLCSDMFKVVALVDISKKSLEHCAQKFKIEKTYTVVGEMLERCPEVDLVMVMHANHSEFHAKHTIECLEAGKHVMVEKPMCLSESEADKIEAARKESGKVVFIGTMRRYAEAFLRVKELVQELPKSEIQYIRVRDIIGSNSFFTEQSGAFPKYFTDFSEESISERKEASAAIHREALGAKADDPRNIRTWGYLNGLATHDISALRELVGSPSKVVSASRSPSGLFLSIVMQYDDFVCYYETGIDEVREFDAHIEIYAKSKHIKVTFDTPYVKGLPIVATVKSSNSRGDHVVQTIRPTYEDAYTLEYKALYDNIINGSKVKTDPVDAKEDLLIFRMIMDAL